jgi:RNA polymerase sigma-70 factor (ECF subfamily)
MMTAILTDETRDLDDDDTLHARMRKGDARAATALYERHSAAAHAAALAVLGDARAADEAVHDVFVALLVRAARCEPPPGGVASWVVKAARQRAIERVAQSPDDGGDPVPASTLRQRSDKTNDR